VCVVDRIFLGTYNSAMNEPGKKYLTEERSINIEGAIALREAVIKIAQKMGISGFLTIFGRNGIEQTSQVIGASAMRISIEVARARIKTVLAVRRSTNLQRERMKEKNQSREDFAGQLGSLFGGGVAIFADVAHTEFIGAMAFGGGTEEQDEEICRKAIEKVGLYTDVV